MNDIFSAGLPARFKQNISVWQGSEGEQWLKDLPKFIGEIAAEWHLDVSPAFPNLSYNYVAPCLCSDKTEAVLKIGFSGDNTEILTEAESLRLAGGNGAVRLLRFDETHRALLLERVRPGESLKKTCQRDDAKATAIAADTMRKFWRKPPPAHNFPDLAKWTAGLSRSENTNFPASFARPARSFFAQLIAASDQEMLLHGDLHHENILSACREPFLAIDPKGIVGDIGYEASVFLNNPRSWVLKHPNRTAILNKRIEIFAQAFEIEAQNLRRWAFATAVLAAWWSFEDNGEDWQKWLACAEMWEASGV